MNRPAVRPSPARRAEIDLDGWLLGEPDLDADALALLGAYREAGEATRKASEATVETAGSTDGAVPEGAVAGRIQPGILRLRGVAGVEDDRLGGLHGRLLAAGYLTAEVLGRSDGLAYRLTREGQRRLAGETADAEAA